MINIQPIGSNVLIDLEQKSEQTSVGGIIIPDSAKEKPSEGLVVAVSTEATDQIVAGDRVIFKEYSGTEIKYEGKKYLLIPDSDVLAKFVEADAI